MKLAYVADKSAGLYIFNVADPASPSLSGGLDTPGEGYATAISGSYAYVTNGLGLNILHITGVPQSYLPLTFRP